MADPRNDMVARLIAPELTGSVSLDTAADLVRWVETAAVTRALHVVLKRAADTGSVSFRQLGIMLGDDVVNPFRKPAPDAEMLPEAVALVEAYTEAAADDGA